jgi:hypothetical protein
LLLLSNRLSTGLVWIKEGGGFTRLFFAVAVKIKDIFAGVVFTGRQIGFIDKIGDGKLPVTASA